MSRDEGPGPCHFVIFGATGHLSRTKLLPALYHLHRLERLNDSMAIVAMGRRPWSTEQWCGHLREWLRDAGITDDDDIFDAFVARFEYVQAI